MVLWHLRMEIKHWRGLLCNGNFWSNEIMELQTKCHLSNQRQVIQMNWLNMPLPIRFQRSSHLYGGLEKLSTLETRLLLMSAKYWRMTHKYGMWLPKSAKEAFELDKLNGSYYQERARTKEMSKISATLKIYSKRTPDNWWDIRRIYATSSMMLKSTSQEMHNCFQ